MKGPPRTNQRRQLLGTLVASAALLSTSCKGHEPEEDVSPGEDLMREHGVIERVLLVYDEAARRLERGDSMPLDLLGRTAGLIRHFIEDYHEKLEEEFVFPRLLAAKREQDLVHTLKAQHERGRALTGAITELTARTTPLSLADRNTLASTLNAFTRMYRPHAAREDTVLFPAFHELLGARAYRELGEQFEDREHSLFGKDGFDDAVKEVAQIEQTLGLYDLAQFTALASG